ncbi:fumarylacetoacetate hydrolase family protein (plasmid) [Skermanella mucosa]|uniref:fumarylacetoacetate hydrolase family protein n=1 Tax=Skermanella mucosa TaxID=1789672 RepID=UPI00192B6F2B|nr:fumarylacetoacetate hydrolase family protein [Skermanella mucosa]UEM24491.1 fumarylacetoacetate hydrolase family protein [Skermanella mucosa]
MKLVTYDPGMGPRIGALQEGRVVDVRSAVAAWLTRQGRPDPAVEAEYHVPSDMTAFLARSGGDLGMATRAVSEAGREAGLDASAVRMLSPVPRPGKILAVGRNYGAHAAEGGLARQEEPRMLAKVPSSVIGPGAPIPRPARVTKLDWEVELAVVIGRTMKDVSEAEALDHVAGYTILNDVSAREFQFDVSPPQTTFAKSMDGFTPMGPVLVTRDELTDPGDLELRCWVNGDLMQEGSTHDLIFPVPYILSFITRYVTLEPGDVVATGTPAGVGHFRTPPVYLKPGDLVRMEIPGIGVLENPVTGSDRT